MIAYYFKLLFVTGMICLPGGFIIRLLANKKMIIKDNPQGQKVMTRFGSYLIIMSSITLVIGILMIIIK